MAVALGLAGVLCARPVAAGDMGKVAVILDGPSPYLTELERELEVSDFQVVRIEATGTGTDDLLLALQRADTMRGIILSNGSARAVLVTVEDGHLRASGEYPIDKRDRVARRRLWIWLGEHLRSLVEEAARPAPRPTKPRLLRLSTVEEPPSLTPQTPSQRTYPTFSLGAASMLGYPSSGTLLSSHVLLIGELAERRCFALFASMLWPLLASTDSTTGFTRRWTFQLDTGVQLALAPPEWVVRPFVGLGLGMQVLITEDRRPGGSGTSDDIFSLLTVGRAGVRVYISHRTALLMVIDGGHTTALTSEADLGPGSPATAWFGHAGIGIVFDR